MRAPHLQRERAIIVRLGEQSAGDATLRSAPDWFDSNINEIGAGRWSPPYCKPGDGRCSLACHMVAQADLVMALTPTQKHSRGKLTSTAAESAFASKADIEWCCEESPLMTQSGRPHCFLQARWRIDRGEAQCNSSKFNT
jgi:hypothetical protein